MRNKPKKRSKSATSTTANFALWVAILNVKGRIKNRMTSIINYLTELPLMVKISENLLCCVLRFFSCVGPVWNFFFIRTPKSDESKKPETS